MSKAVDTRFAVIEDAGALLEMLPPPDRIAWPPELGDLDAVADVLARMTVWLPQVKASLRQHRREVRQRAARSMTVVASGPPP